MAQPSVTDFCEGGSVYEGESEYGFGSRSVAEGDRKLHDKYLEALERVAEDHRSGLEGGSEGVSEDSSGAGDVHADAMAVSVAVANLKDLATRLQKIKRVALLNTFARGRPVRSATTRGGPIRYKQYSVTGSIVVNELEEAGGLYDRFRSGERVIGTMVARTGIGKTTVFPSEVVKKANRRVLLLEPDVKLARYAADAAVKKVAVRKVWAPNMPDYLVTMSYGDFFGHFVGENGRNMLASFDLLIMDESTADVDFIETCRTLLASYASPTLSVLECSATADDRDAQSGGVLLEPVHADVGLLQFIDNGFLFRGDYARDRTMIIANGDRQADEVYRRIYEAGFECMVLDSASRYSDVNKARDFLSQPSSVVNRFIVVVPSYGYGYNIPVSHVVTAGEQIVLELVDNGTRVIEKRIRLSEAQLKQHGGRAGREGNAGVSFIVCASDEDVKVQKAMSFTQRLRVYLMLVACNIAVPSSLYPDVREVLLPYGITKQLALDILALSMPPEVAIRFFARDGKVPYKYMCALEAYAVQDYRFTPSEFDEPVGYDLWVDEVVGGYYGSEVPVEGVTVRVPVRAEGDLQVILHAVATSAVELLEVDNWRCSSSDNELDDVVKTHRRVTSIHGVYRPRVVEDPVPPVVIPRVRGFLYDVPKEEQRGGQLMITSSAAAALSSFATRDLDVDTKNFSVDCPVITEIDRGVERVGIVDSSMVISTRTDDKRDVDVHSPGGSVVVSIRKTVWDKMVVGDMLSGHGLRSFMNSIKSNVDGFVQSDAFSGWTDVWHSVFATLGDADNILVIKKDNLTDRMVALLLALVNRYVGAVKAVARASHVHASLLEAMMAGNSYSRALMKQRSRGKMKILQSQIFFERLFSLREAMVDAVHGMEVAGVFAPTVVITLQQLLPVMRNTGNRTIDAPALSSNFRFRPMLTLGGSSPVK